MPGTFPSPGHAVLSPACHHHGGTVLSFPAGPEAPLTPALITRRRPELVLCTPPGRWQAHIHQTAPRKRAEARLDTPLHTRGFLTAVPKNTEQGSPRWRLGPLEPTGDSTTSPHCSSHSISDPGSNGETEAPRHRPDFIKLKLRK